MVDLKPIRKRQAKKIIAITSSICVAGVAVLVAVALLGQRSSPLTVTLSNSGASLALSQSIAEGSQKTSFLLAKNAPDYTEVDGRELDYFEGELDSEVQGSILTSDKASTRFFKYTFYVENTGSIASDYSLSLNLSYPNRTSNFDLADILRVRFYENADLSAHTYKTYAKASSVYNPETGTYDLSKERITTPDSEFAEMFESNKTVLTSNVSGFAPGERTRYTFVLWLEGNDKDSEGVEAPVGSSIALGVSISAHEAIQEASGE